MLTIRLTRKGKKNQPFFRVVVIDKRRSSKAGRAVEDLGYVNPLTKKRSLNKERILYWLSKGVQPSAAIHNLLVQEKIIEAKKIHVSKIKKGKEAKPSEVPAVPSVSSAPETAAPTQPEAEKPAEPKKEETQLVETPKEYDPKGAPSEEAQPAV